MTDSICTLALAAALDLATSTPLTEAVRKTQCWLYIDQGRRSCPGASCIIIKKWRKRKVLAFCRTSDRFALAPATLATHSNKSTAGLDKRTRNPPTPTAVKGPTSEMRRTSQTRNLKTGRLNTPQFFCTFPIHINWSKIAPYKIVSWILRTSLYASIAGSSGQC